MPKGVYVPLTKDQEDKIKDEFLTKPVKRLADELGVSFGRIIRFLDKNNLEIPREVIEKRIMDSRKKKGDIPFNKGLKQSEWLPKESLIKVRQGQYKKGNTPHNTNSIGNGAIVQRNDDGRIYQYIRIKKSKWVLYHRYLWENENGKVPKGHILVFKDGNTLNTDMSNLELISMAENMYRNSKHDYPREIIPSLVLIKELENKLKDLTNGKK